MIFSKPFESIEFDDVRRMVYDDKVCENMVLDYKRDIPADNEKLAQLISAFANTHGGYIIFGVECEKNSNKPKRIRRLDVGDVNLEDKLEQISMSSIEPPVLGLRSKLLRREDGKQRVFLVQVSESDLTHAVDNNSTVYIRVNSHKKKFIDKADLDKQAWLLDRRKRHIEFRQRLVSESEKRMSAICGKMDPNEICIETVLVPSYPREQLLEIAEIESFVQESRSQLCERHPGNILPFAERTAYRDGACYTVKGDKFRFYQDIGSYGFYRSAVFITCDAGPAVYVKPVQVGQNLQFILGVGLEMLETLDYHGSLQGSLSISNIKGTELWQNPSLEFVAVHGHKPICHLEKHLRIETNFPPGNYWTEKESALVAFFGRLVHLYGAVGDLDAYGQDMILRTKDHFVRKTLAKKTA